MASQAASEDGCSNADMFTLADGSILFSPRPATEQEEEDKGKPDACPKTDRPQAAFQPAQGRDGRVGGQNRHSNARQGYHDEAGPH